MEMRVVGALSVLRRGWSQGLAAAALAVVGLSASSAHAAQLEGAVVTGEPGQGKFGSPLRLEWASSSPAITTSSASQLDVRYQLGASADSDTTFTSSNQTVQTNHVLEFRVQAAPGEHWTLVLRHRRSGHLAIFGDEINSGGGAQLVIGSLTPSIALDADEGTPLAGLTLAQAVLNVSPQRGGPPQGPGPFPLDLLQPVDQQASATVLSAEGSHQVRLSFAWTTSVASMPGFGFQSGAGLEACVRLGIGATEPDPVRCATYPGIPARDQNLDGHFVTVELESVSSVPVLGGGWAPGCGLLLIAAAFWSARALRCHQERRARPAGTSSGAPVAIS